MVKCISCGSEDVVFDTLTNMYYCKSCNHMWDKTDEQEDSSENEGESEQETTSYNSYEEEDLNGFSLVVLHTLMTIPIVDMLLAGVISNSKIKEQYKKTLLYRCITNLLLYTAIIVGVVLFLKESEVIIESKISETVDYVVQLMLPDSEATLYNIPSVKSYEDLLMSHAPQKEEEENNSLPQSVWQYMNGVSMSGKDAISLIEDIKDYDVSVLIQTSNISNKYGNDSYRCLGIVPDMAYYNESSKNWFYDGKTSSEFEFMTDDYGEYVIDSYKDIYQSKYIYYINPKSSFTIHLLHSSDGYIIGVALMEV